MNLKITTWRRIMKKVKWVVLMSILMSPIVVFGESIQNNRTNDSTKASSDSVLENTSDSSQVLNKSIKNTVDSSGVNEKDQKELVSEDYFETLSREAKTPEEYNEVLEYIKNNTDYDKAGQEMQDMTMYSRSARAGKKQGVANYLGITKNQLMNELTRHEYDGFYLGTPFRGLWVPSAQCMSPKGAPNKYGPGFNCTGFVATAFQRAGGDLRQITRVSNAWGDVCNAYNWRDALKLNTEYYEFSSVDQLLKSGKASKGDVLYFEPDFTRPNYDCHIGFFWGSRSNENLMWHSYDRNIKSNIKSATPWTKIMLFKLGDDKNATIKDTKLNNKRFIESKNAAIYSRAYNSGDKSVDTTAGLYHQQVTVTREVVNGHGTWQQFTYEKNGSRKSGWIQKGEFVDIIDKKKVTDKMVLNVDGAVLYDRPYHPGAQTVAQLKNMKHQSVTITEQAHTGYGDWYKVNFSRGNKTYNGWMKTTDFVRISNQTKFERDMTINTNTGSIYDGPYIGPSSTKYVGSTKGMKGKTVSITEKATTGYGEWYKTRFDQEGSIVSGWIKSVDVETYVNHEIINETKYVNKDFGSVYDKPYDGINTKNVDTLNGKINTQLTVTEKAETNYGLWFKTRLGWIKSVDLSDQLVTTQVQLKQTINTDRGTIYKAPYTGKETSVLITTKQLKYKTVELTERAETSFGSWYKTSLMVNDQLTTGWIKSVDLDNYYNHAFIATNYFINKDGGAIYNRPYDGNGTKRVDTLSGKLNRDVKATEKAETLYGTWYKTEYGWVKSVDLSNDILTEKIDSHKTINTANGAIYNMPYVGSKTKRIATTKGLDGQSIKLVEQSKTPYGLWYKSVFMIGDEKTEGWIKSVDLNNYYNHEKLDTRLIVNRNNGMVYDRPYDGKETKGVGNLTGMFEKPVSVSEKAETDYGVWYKVNFKQGNKVVIGWVKSVDLDETMNSQTLNTYQIVTREIGSIYDSPYAGPKKTTYIGNTKTLYLDSVLAVEKVTTGYGTWIHVKQKQTDIGWIKSVDLSTYKDHKKVAESFVVNTSSGAVYDRPYDGKETNKIGNLDGMKNTAIDVTEKAETAYGIWYKTNFKQGDKTVTGWVKSVDLD